MEQDLVTEYNGRVLEARNLPALPAVVIEMNRLMSDPNSSVEQLSQVVIKDQAIAAKVLKMVNSPIYGFPGRISSVQHAMVLLGVNVIRGLIISMGVFDSGNKAMIGLWEHSLACSVACGEIANITGQRQPEEYSIMGLLHDMGKVVFAAQIPEAWAEAARLVVAEDILFKDAEQRVLGFGHERINSWICKHWNLPVLLRDGLAYHHAPLAAPFHPEAAAVVQLGDFMARLFEAGNGGDSNVPPLDAGALRLLGVNHKIIEEILDSLFIKLGDGIFAM